MKNSECIIYITTKKGYRQIYRKDKNGWTQTSQNGIIRKMSAEQFLSHLLPPLTVENNGRLIVSVKRKKRDKKTQKKELRKKNK